MYDLMDIILYKLNSNAFSCLLFGCLFFIRLEAWMAKVWLRYHT